MAEEGQGILAAIPAGATVIALDPRGRSLSSEDFSARLGLDRDRGASAACLVIGGADGLSDALRRPRDVLLAFGAATFPPCAGDAGGAGLSRHHHPVGPSLPPRLRRMAVSIPAVAASVSGEGPVRKGDSHRDRVLAKAPDKAPCSTNLAALYLPG